jgi:hypothetical protein
MMSRPDIQTLLEYCIDHDPGITTQKLFEYTKEWYGGTNRQVLWSLAQTIDFERALTLLRNKGFRCTNKNWYSGAAQRRMPKPRARFQDIRQGKLLGD